MAIGPVYPPDMHGCFPPVRVGIQFLQVFGCLVSIDVREITPAIAVGALLKNHCAIAEKVDLAIHTALNAPCTVSLIDQVRDRQTLIGLMPVIEPQVSAN